MPTKKIKYWAIVEKHNRHAIHGIFDSEKSANDFLDNTIPEYVYKQYFVDKTLTKDSFEVIQHYLTKK